MGEAGRAINEGKCFTTSDRQTTVTYPTSSSTRFVSLGDGQLSGGYIAFDSMYNSQRIMNKVKILPISCSKSFLWFFND